MRTALGIHIGNDRGAAIVCDGHLIAQLAEERLDRQKHSKSPELPKKAIAAVLDICGIRPSDVAVVGLSYTNVTISAVIEQLAPEIRDHFKNSALTVLGFDHHDCHAWSSYFTSGWNEALVLVADGAGDIVGERLEAESLYFGEGGRLEVLDRRLQESGLARPGRRNSFNLAYMTPGDRKKQISLGRKYEQFTYLVGFGEGEGGKTMALAAYASPLFPPRVPEINTLQFPLTFEDGLAEIDDLWHRSGQPWHEFVKKNVAGIAATGQAIIEGYVTAYLRNLRRTTPSARLCCAGGLFLNCRLNHRILSDTGFDELHVIPAAGDDGQCVGASFAAYAAEFGPPQNSRNSLPFLGACYSGREVDEALGEFGMKTDALDDQRLIQVLAADLARGRTVAQLRGRSELGPRALCHRSILADPRRGGMKDWLNAIKGRERFRPFAPVVTAEDQFNYFELQQSSKYMLLAASVRPEWRSLLPAITHVDGTSRVQALDREDDPFVYALLRAFEKRSGFPVLLNTSFNLRGDPIVESPRDAISSFLNSEIDVLVLGNHYLSKTRRGKLEGRLKISA